MYSHYEPCQNPDCPNGGVFIPNRADQHHCDKKCRNRANYIKRKDLLAARYADIVDQVKIDQKLERLLKDQPEGYVYTDEMLRLLEIRLNSAISILRDPKNGKWIHMFSNYGLVLEKPGLYTITKKIKQ